MARQAAGRLSPEVRGRGKVNTRTLANLSKLPPEAIEVLRRSLKGDQLIACRNSAPAERRRAKREALLEATAAELDKVRRMVGRGRIHGKEAMLGNQALSKRRNPPGFFQGERRENDQFVIAIGGRDSRNERISR